MSGRCCTVSLLLQQAPQTGALAHASLAEKAQSRLFLHEVVALGLRSNYAQAHPHARLPPQKKSSPDDDKEDDDDAARPAASALAMLLLEVLPERYCRRLSTGRVRVARELLGRADAAAALVGGTARCDDTKALRAAEAEEERPFKEHVVLLNGDEHDGHWRFGRKHGKGKYTFASGAKYEGKWDNGKMTGIGWYTQADGSRHCVDLRKKQPPKF